MITSKDDDDTIIYNYYATEGGSGLSSMSNYEATLTDLNDKSPTKYSSIKIGDSTTDATQLTSSTSVLMLMPQALQAWIPTTSTVINYVGNTTSENSTEDLNYALSDGNTAVSTEANSQTYLAIDCEIYHKGMTDIQSKVHDGLIFVPFETNDIAYNTATTDNTAKAADEWLAGYKITYCLEFGGGFVVEEDHSEKIPEPGCIPDTETYTLRTIRYTTTCDAWVDVAANTDLDEFVNGCETDTSYEE